MFVMQPDGMARLDFIQVCRRGRRCWCWMRLRERAIARTRSQNMEYKFVDLLSVSFVRSPDDVVRQQICYRYNSMKVRSAASRRARVLPLQCVPHPTRPCSRDWR